MPPLNGAPSWFKEARETPCPVHAAGRGRHHARGYVDRSLDNITSFTKRLIAMDNGTGGRGALQSIEPSARLFGLLAIALAAAITAHSIVLGLIILATAMLALGSRVGLVELVKRTAPSAVFAFIMMTPAFLGFIFPGEETLPMGPSAYKTALTSSQAAYGAPSVFFFVSRVVAVVSLAALLSLTTTPGALFNGLKRLKVPPLFVATLFMTFRYLFILLTIAEDAALAGKSRTIGRADTASSRRWFASRAALILKKAMNTADEVGMAMASRGFTGTFKTFTGPPLVGRDYLWIGFSLFVFFISLGF
ncbi:MAG: hypothetical protein HY886_06195 [Deltaproteobacteria bacterium]|nr:hypothetical protein [Deltaproteobacteria bacterium]